MHCLLLQIEKTFRVHLHSASPTICTLFTRIVCSTSLHSKIVLQKHGVGVGALTQIHGALKFITESRRELRLSLKDTHWIVNKTFGGPIHMQIVNKRWIHMQGLSKQTTINTQVLLKGGRVNTTNTYNTKYLGKTIWNNERCTKQRYVWNTM